jgi:hypothetical protein
VIARNTLANANAVRDWRIYADFAQSLIGIARPLYAQESFGVDLQETVYALGTTSVSVGISVGGVPHGQGSHQVAYAARSARQHRLWSKKSCVGLKSRLPSWFQVSGVSQPFLLMIALRVSPETG